MPVPHLTAQPTPPHPRTHWTPDQDPIYVGTKHRRVRGDAYYELVDEFLTAVRRRYGTAGESRVISGCSREGKSGANGSGHMPHLARPCFC